jgi:hypothetical protein
MQELIPAQCAMAAASYMKKEKHRTSRKSYRKEGGVIITMPHLMNCVKERKAQS